MKTLSILMQGEPGVQWKEWINGLTHAGCIIHTMDPLAAEYSDFHAIKSEAVLLDGMLPRLAMIIALLRALRPDLRLIIASELDSFAIRYEAMRLGETAYIPGPMPPDQFESAIEKALV